LTYTCLFCCCAGAVLWFCAVSSHHQVWLHDRTSVRAGH